MSGQPYLTAYDPIKFRNQYMANLNLQIKNDDINLQANKIFKKTGQTPVQPTDTRNTTEKMADIERLKIDLRSSFSKIADGQQSQEIVNQLALDPQDIQFAAQHINDIISIIGHKYQYGITNALFVPLFNDYKANFVLTNGLSSGMQAAAGQQLMLTIAEIQRDMPTRANLGTVIDTLNAARGLMENRLRNQITAEITQLRNLLDLPDLTAMLDAMPPGEAAKSMIQLEAALVTLPTAGQLNDLLRPLRIAIQRADKRAADAAGAALLGSVTVSPGAAATFSAAAAGGGGGASSSNPFSEFGLSLPSSGDISPNEPSSGDVSPNVPDAPEIPPRPAAFDPSAVKVKQKKGKTLKEPITMWGLFLTNLEEYDDSHTKGKFPGLTKTELSDLDQELHHQLGYNYNTTGKTDKSVPVYVKRLKNNIGEINDYFNPPEAGGQGIGLHRIKGRGLNIDYSKGIQESTAPKYIPFGKFIINPKRLENDIITLRRPKGSVPMPTTRTSPKLGSVIRKIVGGGSPSFEDLNSLDNEEKHYLHKLMKTTNLLDRVSVPAPSKEQDDKDTNRFDVLRGEIMSGNDSHQLIKEFKLLIMKLVNKDLLPKSQSREILYDLMALGF